MIGIYKITSPTGKIYIGQSRDIEERIRQHKWDLRVESKNKSKLRNSFKKYGFENHKFEIKEECSIELLNERERYWQDFYDVLGENGLNHILQEAGEKVRVFGEEYRQKIKVTSTGRVMSKESRQKSSQSLLGKSHSQERREKNRVSQLGKKHLDSSKEKCRVAASKLVINKLTREIFDSNNLAAKSIGVKPNWLSARLRGDVENTTSFEYLHKSSNSKG